MSPSKFWLPLQRDIENRVTLHMRSRAHGNLTQAAEAMRGMNELYYGDYLPRRAAAESRQAGEAMSEV